MEAVGNAANVLFEAPEPLVVDHQLQVYFIDLSQTYLKYIRWQWHSELEIVIVNHGEADVMIDNKMIHLAPGQGFFINQNVLHSIHPYGDSRNCTLYSLSIPPEFLFDQNSSLTSKYITPVLNSPDLKTFLLDEAEPSNEKLLDLINDVIAANAVKAYGYELVTRAKLYDFWQLLLQIVEIKPGDDEVPPPQFSLDEIRCKNVIRFVEEHYAKPLTLEMLAEAMHISKSECCRTFMRTLKMTPIEYVMRYRIFVAARLMYSEDPVSDSISELAFAVGFNSLSYFTKTFRKVLRQTPREYKTTIAQTVAPQAESFIMLR
jgi:AraC-like DNA-binding protein/mannose-6-phosphate isomerase-like protein (cupin superfamily)